MRQRIRDIPQIRSLFKAYLGTRKKRDHDRYLRSPDSWYLKTLQGIHAGKRCFIIGNGPSLRAKDLERLKGEYTFASNRIYEIFEQTDWRPVYYFAIDPDFLRENLKKLRSYDLGHMFLCADEESVSGYPINSVTRIYKNKDAYFPVVRPNLWNDFTSYVSVDISDHFSEGLTVTFAAIQMAIYMGFSEIYLLGVDFSYSVVYDADGTIQEDKNVQDYFTGKRHSTTLQNYASNLHAYKMAKEYCDNHGIKIYNATRGGKLEVFERVDFDTIVAPVSLV